jgi:hypothetical protein
LDLKDHVAGSDNETSNSGGLVLPRVQLVSKTTLQPFIASASGTNLTEHIGLTVYNLTTTNGFHEGIYVWTGTEWRILELASSYVYVPSFNLPWGTNLEYNLYLNAYKANFNPTGTTSYISSRGTGIVVPFPDFDDAPTDFYYVVTYYDPQVLTITQIEENGIMHYTKGPGAATAVVPPDDAYINVVMIRKN